MKVKKFLLLGIFAALAAFCLTPGFAFADDTVSPTPLKFDDEGFCGIYATSGSGSGKQFCLEKDVENGAIAIFGDTAGTQVTIDLKGHTLTQTKEVYYTKGAKEIKVPGTIYLYADSNYKVNVKIINSDPEHGGIVQNCSSRNAIFLNASDSAQSPMLTLEDIKVSSRDTTCMAIYRGEASIDNSTLEMVSANSSDGAVYIESAHSAYSQNKLTVNSGNLIGSTKENAKDIISVANAGSGKYVNPAAITLNGGTYNQAPTTANLGEGKYIYQSNSSEYTVGENHDGYDYAVVPSDLGGVWFKDSEAALAYKNSFAFSKKTFHTVSFVSSNRTSVPDQYVIDGYKVAKPTDPSDPSYDGLAFESWQVDGAGYDFNLKVNSDLTLVAKYSGNAASVDGKTYATLQEAINAATSGQTVKLIRSTLENVELNDSSKDITVDLDGNVLLNGDASSPTIIVSAGHVRLQNGLVKYLRSDDVVDDTYAVLVEGKSASAEFDINANSDGDAAVYVDTASSAQILGGSYMCSSSGDIQSTEPGVLTVANSTVSINDGVFNSTEGVSSIVNYKSTISVSGGSFSSDIKYGDENEATYSLQGGQYDVMPSLDFVANGYVLYKPADPDIPDDLKGETSPYSVVSADSDLVKNASAFVAVYGKTIYYESAAEAKAYATAHKDEGAVATIYLTAELSVPVDVVYDGNAKEATASFDYEGASEDGVTAVIGYSTDSGKLESAPVDAGTYSAAVTGLSDSEQDSCKYVLKGEAKGTFTIAQAEPKITVSQSINKVLGDEDFSLQASVEPAAVLSYSSNNSDIATVDEAGKVHIKAAGTAALVVSVAETKNYKSASKNVTLNVAAGKYDIVGAAVTLKQGSWVYDGNQKKPEVSSVTLNGVQLFEDTDFTLTYGDNVNAGTGTLTLEGVGDYTGTKQVDFLIEKAATSIDVKEPGEMMTGNKLKIEPSAFVGATFSFSSSKPEVASVSADGMVEARAAGTADITVSTEGDSNHNSASKIFTLVVKATPSPSPDPTPVTADISAAKVTLSKTAFIYNGKAQKPSVKSVVLNGKTLVAGADYTASVASGKKVGTYAVTITAKGSYTGKTTSSFVINPKGVTKFKVSKAKKSFKAKWAKNKTERSGVQLKYSTKKSMAKAKTVKAKGAAAKAKTVKKLKKKTKCYVQARAYKVVNGKTYYSGWSAKKAVKTK